MEIKPLFIVLLDIGGYTRFIRLTRTSRLHAEKIVADLLQAMTQATEHPMTLNKIEGDALLLYADATDNQAATGRDVLRQIVACIDSFSEELQKLVSRNVCICDACRHAEELKIKAFVHFDDTVVRGEKGNLELGGEGVILAHRLMKNSLDVDEYILMTKEAREYCGAVDGFKEIVGRESYDELGNIDTFAFVPSTGEAAIEPKSFSLGAKTLGVAYLVKLDLYMLKRLFSGSSSAGQYRNLPN